MRYYYYGNEEKKPISNTENCQIRAAQSNPGVESRIQRIPVKKGQLIIDEDSVYEIDTECVECKKNRGREWEGGRRKF